MIRIFQELLALAGHRSRQHKSVGPSAKKPPPADQLSGPLGNQFNHGSQVYDIHIIIYYFIYIYENVQLFESWYVYPG